MIRSAPWLRYLSAFSAITLAACSNLPSSGPSNAQVLQEVNSEKNPLGLHIIDLTPAVVQTLGGRTEPSLSVIDKLRSNRPSDQLGPGDVISVSIYETGNGLFTPQRPSTSDNAGGPTSSSTAETLPRLQVDRNGMIMVPYAGEIHVAGLTTTAVQHLIENRLHDKTAQAQVLVSNGSNVAYVSGDVRHPGRYGLSLAQETLLDMIALAGGPTHSPQDIYHCESESAGPRRDYDIDPRANGGSRKYTR